MNFTLIVLMVFSEKHIVSSGLHTWYKMTMRKEYTEDKILELLLESDIEDASDDSDNELLDHNAHEDAIVFEDDADSDFDGVVAEGAKKLFDEEVLCVDDMSKLSNRNMKWVFKKFNTTYEELSNEDSWNVENREKWTPFNYFCDYFNENFWAFVSEQSNIHALQCNVDLKSTPNEYKKVVGAHIIAGCMKLPRIRMYYKPSIKVAAITQIPREGEKQTLENSTYFGYSY
ncbi:uncharacterized protein LOC119682631 [Teleopsis dalmanni]|uniref:uncharacterized protein LOC119682631 n=1 Tax=Teleopsis dalmanni TaxID=139649 RepID=UPI0018CE386D|nr:uncharacterized protein LOC119682631 [Teleopsis dalmanni]